METGALRDLNRWRQPSEVLSRNRAVIGGSYVSVAHRDCEKHEESFAAVTEKVTATMQIAKQIYSLAQGQNDSALIIEACVALATPLYFLGDFEAAREYARLGPL